jgi:integrase
MMPARSHVAIQMAGKQAKILSKDQLSDLLLYASCTRHAHRNILIALLSAKAGLRAGEISKLTWDMVLEPLA